MKTRSKSSKAKPKLGRPTKATPELLAKLCAKLAAGFTEEQSCAALGVYLNTFADWKKRPEFPQIFAGAQHDYIEAVRAKKDAAEKGWQRFSWDLERPKLYRDQFGEPKESANFTLNQQLNVFDPAFLAEARGILDKQLNERGRTEEASAERLT